MAVLKLRWLRRGKKRYLLSIRDIETTNECRTESVSVVEDAVRNHEDRSTVSFFASTMDLLEIHRPGGRLRIESLDEAVKLHLGRIGSAFCKGIALQGLPGGFHLFLRQIFEVRFPECSNHVLHVGGTCFVAGVTEWGRLEVHDGQIPLPVLIVGFLRICKTIGAKPRLFAPT